jgi:hypothetical protein
LIFGLRVLSYVIRETLVVLFFPVRFSRSSRGRLTDRDLARFPGETLLDRVGRTACHARCLPRKELYEAWETARRVRRLFRGGRIVDLAAGHGLLAQLMLILDDTSPCALAVDAVVPPSAATLQQMLVERWPRLGGRITFVLQRATVARARVAVLPCCHDVGVCDAGAL